MRRRTFDLIASSVGVLLAVLLLVAGGLLIWAYTFVNNQVTTQLTEQQIVFPAADSAAMKALPLRGLFAFWQIGQIALYAAIAAFVGGAIIFLVLAIIGFLHMRRTPAEAELQPVGG